MYILLSKEDVVQEIIPDIDPVFPGIPIEERYAPDFVDKLLHAPDDESVEQHWRYDRQSGKFSPPGTHITGQNETEE